MKWIEVSIKTTTEAVDAVSNILYDAGVTGVVIIDPNDINFVSDEEKSWDYVDESLYNIGFEGALVKGYLSETADLKEKLKIIENLVAYLPNYGLDIGLGEVTTNIVDENDWANAWKQYYKTTRIGKNIVIKPTWEEYSPLSEDLVIDLDPGMAFGTGTHETTMMCIEGLEKAVKEDTTVFDIGCGSGILSIAAAKLGAKKVVAIDLDKVAVHVSIENVEKNEVSHIVEVKHGNLMDVITDKADIVVANIIADIIILLSRDIKNYLNNNGLFITSGIILDKINDVKDSLEENGLKVIEVNTKGEWAAITAKVEDEMNE
ncbi:50S ribosomal protein L11 methyltransferase [Serpentinicella alkaliphila]|uniref:Ribosomal protein L11 methyltransferase n=1 Tax=Serpentinicella alkaliphila TaxID=1734049 RepID=A0A4R2TYH3_9FIRM|nr:50S ribosomal protein L11 methyltransferase [Serpentinicella alkaliphila]QUH26914.1 50S ribosomal protein L11 methyltransferase [Serpentinicella alkaliphila]TCQ08147.1 [LSU ribosomal protein L11P]-lysine N-methyltransferase [Serpentinicella alkaliphila]